MKLLKPQKLLCTLSKPTESVVTNTYNSVAILLSVVVTFVLKLCPVDKKMAVSFFVSVYCFDILATFSTQSMLIFVLCLFISSSFPDFSKLQNRWRQWLKNLKRKLGILVDHSNEQ